MEVAVQGENKIIVNSQGVELTGAKITLPDQDFNLFGLLKLSVRDMALEYTGKPNRMLKIQGRSPFQISGTPRGFLG